MGHARKRRSGYIGPQIANVVFRRYFAGADMMKPNLWVLLGAALSFFVGMKALPMPNTGHAVRTAHLRGAGNVRLASAEFGR